MYITNNNPRILQCEGYCMFYGTMLITPNNPNLKPFKEKGVWLYKPEYKCWYCNGSSYMEDICTIDKPQCICKRDL